MDEYRNLADEYDTFFDTEHAVRKQKKFFQSLIKKYRIKTCLDCACGTGWHLSLLHDMGLHCAGSDLSATMLKKARKNLHGKKIPLKVEDYRFLQRTWKQRFDMIICLTTGFAHMLTDKDAMQALHSMLDRLNDGGILVISNGIADSTFREQPRLIPGNIQQNHAMYFFLEYPSEKRIIFNVIRIKKTRTGFTHAFDRVEYNAMCKNDFERWFKRVLFRKVNYYGDHSLSQFSRNKSDRIVIVAQK